MTFAAEADCFVCLEKRRAGGRLEVRSFGGREGGGGVVMVGVV